MQTGRALLCLAMMLAALCLGGCGGGSGSDQKPAARPRAKSLKPKQAPPTEGSEIPAETPAAQAPGPVQPVYRPDDDRPAIDPQRIKALGIRRYESKRLALYTDIPDDQADTLPDLMDDAYKAWEAYFGPLPPARDRSEFQVNGFIMADQSRFREAGLLPETLPPFQHGRHRGLQFWMNDQKDAYYREHLMLHEGTHCFMTIVPNPMASAVWYMEGMAECFGTHFRPPDKPTQFGVMPHDRDAFPGPGRIRMIRDEVARGKALELTSVFDLLPDEFVQKNESYAWSWAACQFLATHPRYRERFRTVQQNVRPRDAAADFLKLFEPDWTDLQDEWRLFAHNLCHGFDVERATIEFHPGQPLAGESVVGIKADRGWQSSRIRVEAGKMYEVSASGRFTLARSPKPWISEANGVSIRYCEGRPLGMLLAFIRSEAPVAGAPGGTTMLQVLPIGRQARLVPKVTGTLFFRLNEFWNELADNTGEANVTVVEAVK